MTAQVKPWGNSQGIRLSRQQLAQAGFQLNEELEIEIHSGCILLRKAFRHKTLEERAAECAQKPGPYNESLWDSPEGREVW